MSDMIFHYELYGQRFVVSKQRNKWIGYPEGGSVLVEDDDRKEVIEKLKKYAFENKK